MDGDEYRWWKAELERVARSENLPRCSMRTLLTRIANADLDLTLNGISRYAQLKLTKTDPG
jgi:hypothetical protein